LEHAVQLGEAGGRVEPVEGLRDRDGVERAAGEWQCFRHRRGHGHGGQFAMEHRAHPGNRLDREQQRARWHQQPRQLAGAGRQVADGPAGRDAELLGQPCDGVGRVRRPCLLVLLGAVAESPRRDVVHCHA
jgi:hypothetical protein